MGERLPPRRPRLLPIIQGGADAAEDPASFGDQEAMNLAALGEPRYPTTRQEWALFPVQIVTYNDGRVSGRRLLIDGWSVMEEWERVVEQRTMRVLFDRTTKLNPTILIGGEGLGYTTRTAIEEARLRGGGNIKIVELHPRILNLGKMRIAKFMRDWSEEEKERVKVEFILGDFRETIEDREKFPDNSVDAARIDLFPLSPEERDIDSFVHMRALMRLLTPSAVVAPFIGHSENPTAQQLAYMKDEVDNELFAQREYAWVWVRPPKDCPYYKDNLMVIGIWSKPVKRTTQFLNAHASGN